MKFALALIALASLGCAPKHRLIVLDGHHIDGNAWVEDEPAIRARASYDLQCDSQSLELRILAVATIDYSMYTAIPGASQVGVDGCDQRAVYVRTPSGWVMNTTSAE